MEKNGRMSAGSKSRHINVRFFWIKDQVKESGITIRHCPTWAMLADFLTKPLQGQLFRKFVAVLLGHTHVDTLAEPTVGPVEERVGEGLPDTKVNAATGVVDTGTGSDSTAIEVPKVKWADIVRKPANAHVAPAAGSVSSAKYVLRADVSASAVRGHEALKKCKFVSRSFLRNNSVNKTSKA